MKKIYLHIGVHKTGTTSLQQFTRKNHELLSELGLYVPPPGKTIDAQGNEINLGSAGGGLHAIPKSISGKDPYVLNAFLNDFENSQLNSALISSEGFDSLEKNDINFLADLLKNYQVQPVVVFRHPVHLARSIYCSLGRISPVQGTRLIDSKLFFTHPGYLFSKIWPSKEQSSKISRTNFILRQATRRIYDFQGICRDWSCLGKVKVFLFEQSTNIAEDILQHLLQDNTNSLQAIKDMNIPRLRSSLPVPVAVLNNELYTSLNIDINIYHKHIYPYLVNFSRSKKIEKIQKEQPFKNLFPFSNTDQIILLKKIKDKMPHSSMHDYIDIHENNRDSFNSGREYYKKTVDFIEVPKHIIQQTKELFIKYCLKPTRFKV